MQKILLSAFALLSVSSIANATSSPDLQSNMKVQANVLAGCLIDANDVSIQLEGTQIEDQTFDDALKIKAHCSKDTSFKFFISNANGEQLDAHTRLLDENGEPSNLQYVIKFSSSDDNVRIASSLDNKVLQGQVLSANGIQYVTTTGLQSLINYSVEVSLVGIDSMYQMEAGTYQNTTLLNIEY